MATIKINGVTYTGNNLSVMNGKVYVNGQELNTPEKNIDIAVEGNIDNLDVDYANRILVTGDVRELTSGSGDVTLSNGNVLGSVTTGSGDVDCEGVGGNVRTGSGDVDAANIGGSVKTGSGDIKHRKL